MEEEDKGENVSEREQVMKDEIEQLKSQLEKVCHWSEIDNTV